MRHLISKISTLFIGSLAKLSLALSFTLFASFTSYSSADEDAVVLSLDTTGVSYPFDSVKITGPWWQWSQTSTTLPVATDEDGDGVYEISGLVSDETELFEYLWVVVPEDTAAYPEFKENFTDNGTFDGDGNFLRDPITCAPLHGVNDGTAFANRVWLSGDGNRLDTFDDCSGPAPTSFNVTLTATIPGNPGTVRLMGNIDDWKIGNDWVASMSPVATSNNDGTYSVTLNNLATSFEYLWAVADSTPYDDLSGADLENALAALNDSETADYNNLFVQEDLKAQEVDGVCANSDLSTGYGAEGIEFANRQWTYGSDNILDVEYEVCTGQLVPPTDSPAPTENANDVLSVFSSHLGSMVYVAGGAAQEVDFNPNWGQQTSVAIDEDNGLLVYYGLNFQGTTFLEDVDNPGSQNKDVSSYEYLNIDFYTENSTELDLFLVNYIGPQEAYEMAYTLTDDIELNQWNSVQIPLMAFAGVVDLTAINQIKIDGDGDIAFDNIFFGGSYNPAGDYDNDFVDNANDPMPADASFFDMSKAAFSDAFAGVTIDEGYVYAYPNTAETYAGFANKNDSLYPISMIGGGKISFTGSVPTGGDPVAIKFTLQDQAHPNTDDDLTIDSSVVVVSGTTPQVYTATFEASDTDFNNLLMYIVAPDPADETSLANRDNGVVVTDVVVNADTQVVSVSDAKAMVGGSASVTVTYSAEEVNLTGLGLRVHYDSSVLTPTSIADVLASSIIVSPDLNNLQSDSDNADGISATDTFINMSWATFGTANWPGTSPVDLLTINFNVAEGVTDQNTVIGFSKTSTATNYELDGSRVLVEFTEGSWDFDGSGTADALSDGLLLLRYAFGMRGPGLTAAARADNDLTDAEIQETIKTATESYADIDGNGSVDALSDGLLLLRYLFGMRGPGLVAAAADTVNGSRTTGDEVAAYIDSYMP